MYTSENKKLAAVTFRRYLIVSAFCGVFGFIYELFSHDVYSASMALMFLFPLIGGALPFGIMTFTGHPYYPGRLDRNLYDCGIATLTVGSCFKGVLDIYGTTSKFSNVYLIAGLVLTVAGLILYLVSSFFVAKLQH
ncbi:MAG: hypothetical protein LKM41_13710 [Lachnospiraceae bacterium]|nr:hypothetical protein [Lachnospiraceae bacterium]